MQKSDAEGELDVFPVNRDLFLRRLVRSLAGTLEDVVGIEEASGFISIVGQDIGKYMSAGYRAKNDGPLDLSGVTLALVDLKRQIEGDFYVIEQTEKQIILGNRRCPFGSFVEGHPSLCMMTSNVFGTVVSDNLGYARVSLEKTIARMDGECRIVIDLDPDASGSPAHSQMYFGT